MDDLEEVISTTRDVDTLYRAIRRANAMAAHARAIGDTALEAYARDLALMGEQRKLERLRP